MKKIINFGKEKGIAFICLILIMALIIGCTIYIIEKEKAKKVDEQNQQIQNSNSNIEIITEADSNYADVEGIVDSFLDSIMKKDAIKLTNVLKPLYKKQFQVSEDNIVDRLYTKLNLYGNDVELVIDKMLVYKNTDHLGVYFVYGHVENGISSEETNLKIMVELNSETRHYTITPTDGVEKLGFGNVSEKNFMNITSLVIEENKYNVY